MKTLVLGPILWDSIWGHAHELTRILSKEQDVTYLEPIVHSSNHSLSFQRTTQNQVPDNVHIIRRNTNLGLGVIYGIYCELINLYYLVKLDYDVFITYYTSCAFLATVFSRLTRKKVVLMYVDDLAEWYEPTIAKIMTNYLFTPLVIKFSNLTVTTAHKLEEFAYNYSKQVEYIPNGVNLSSFQDFKVIFEGNKSFVVGFVGSFGSRINYDLIIGAAVLLKNEKNVKFLFAGGGEGFDYFNQKIDELSLDNIQLLGVVSHSEVPLILSKMDVGIIPFKINRLTDCISPVKLFEYWSMGKPVISTSFYEIKKIAHNKIIFADNSEELKDAILNIKNNRDIHEKYASIGLKEVKKYDWNVLGDKYLKLITRLE